MKSTNPLHCCMNERLCLVGSLHLKRFFFTSFCVDVALVTSLRDGMNLVSYEFVACQASKKGVLILSEVCFPITWFYVWLLVGWLRWYQSVAIIKWYAASIDVLAISKRKNSSSKLVWSYLSPSHNVAIEEIIGV